MILFLYYRIQLCSNHVWWLWLQKCEGEHMCRLRCSSSSPSRVEILPGFRHLPNGTSLENFHNPMITSSEREMARITCTFICFMFFFSWCRWKLQLYFYIKWLKMLWWCYNCQSSAVSESWSEEKRKVRVFFFFFLTLDSFSCTDVDHLIKMTVLSSLFS